MDASGCRVSVRPCGCAAMPPAGLASALKPRRPRARRWSRPAASASSAARACPSPRPPARRGTCGCKWMCRRAPVPRLPDPKPILRGTPASQQDGEPRRSTRACCTWARVCMRGRGGQRGALSGGGGPDGSAPGAHSFRRGSSARLRARSCAGCCRARCEHRAAAPAP